MAAQPSPAVRPPPVFPPPDSDFHLIAECLNDSERAVVGRVRSFMETQVAPVIAG